VTRRIALLIICVVLALPALGQTTLNGAGATFPYPIYSKWFSEYSAAHPGVEITLLEDNSDRLIEDVRSGATDLALIGAAGTPPTGVESLVVVKEQLVAAVPCGHPLAGRHRATLAEVCAYPIVSLPHGAGIRTVFDLACDAGDIRADIALQASAPGAVAVSPDGKTLFVANSDNNNVAVIDIADVKASRIEGFIPVGWYPTALAISPDNHTLYVANGKGLRSRANFPAKSDTPRRPMRYESSASMPPTASPAGRR